MTKKKLKRYKVGLQSETNAISFVSEPAIMQDFIYMEEQQEPEVLKLSSDEKHMVYGPILIPNHDIYRNNGEMEYYLNFSRESIEKMQKGYMRNFNQFNVTLQHQEMADEVCLVESWIVEDSYKDKANYLGFSNVEPGTWFGAFYVNNVDTWNRIKSGELKGFSVESKVFLEEFNKIEENNMVETNEMFWDKLKQTLKEMFSSNEEAEPNEPVVEEKLEEEKPTEPIIETPKVEEPTETPKVEEAPKVEEPIAEAPKVEEEPKKEEPNPLEELVKNLTEEVKSLKEMNEGLNKKVKELGKQPSAKPVNTNAKPSAGNTYQAWREQMAKYIG